MGRSAVIAGLAVLAGLTGPAGVGSADVTVDLASYQFLSAYVVWEYSYTIDNTSGTSYIYYLELDPVDVTTVTGFPTGWGSVYADTSVGGFATWSASSTSDWLAPGGTLGGFVIESPYGPGPDYATWGISEDTDGSLGGDTSFVYGLIAGPHVPEPGTLLLLACGIGVLAARHQRVARRVRS